MSSLLSAAGHTWVSATGTGLPRLAAQRGACDRSRSQFRGCVRLLRLQKVLYNSITKIESQEIKGQEEFSSEWPQWKETWASEWKPMLCQ